MAFACVLAWCPRVAFADVGASGDDAIDSFAASAEAADVTAEDEGFVISGDSDSSADEESADVPNDAVEPATPGDSDDSANSSTSEATSNSEVQGDVPSNGKAVSREDGNGRDIASACNDFTAYQFGEAGIEARMLGIDESSAARAIDYADQADEESSSGEDNQAGEAPLTTVSASDAHQAETSCESHVVATASRSDAIASSATPCIDELAYQNGSEGLDYASELDGDEPLVPKRPISPQSPAPANPAPPVEPGGPVTPTSISSVGSNAGSAQQLGDAAVTPDSASLHTQRLSLRTRGFVSKRELPRHGGYLRCRSPSMS